MWVWQQHYYVRKVNACPSLRQLQNTDIPDEAIWHIFFDGTDLLPAKKCSAAFLFQISNKNIKGHALDQICYYCMIWFSPHSENNNKKQ